MDDDELSVVRASTAATLQKMIDDLMVSRERGDVATLEAVPQLVDLLDRLDRVIGLYMPERVVIVDDERAAPDKPVDLAVVEAIRAKFGSKPRPERA